MRGYALSSNPQPKGLIMASIKGTRTEVNLLTSFAGESQARNRYTFFASVAKKEGFIQISEIFTETANQEKEHAERMFKFLEGGMVEIKAAYPAGVIGKTIDNLLAAAGGEYEEWHDLYPSFAKTAQEEGFEDVAQMYGMIAVAEAFQPKLIWLVLTAVAVKPVGAAGAVPVGPVSQQGPVGPTSACFICQ